MPGWDEILDEIKGLEPFQYTTKNYLEKLYETTKRNAICYYSAFLSKSAQSSDLSINDSDMEGFMNAVKGLDKTLGLDLILHTPGGSPTATESIVKYLRSIFGTDIRVIVPHMAMSAGTMIACAGESIVMGRQSSLGPIDPQYNGVPAYNIVRMFKEAQVEMHSDPKTVNYWAIQLAKYDASMIYDCINAIDLSTELVTKWLKTGMFKNEAEKEKLSLAVVENLNENENSKNHGRHFDKETCKEYGLKITDLEEDNKLQDAVLSVHHAYMLFLSNTSAIKIISNHTGKSFIVQSNNPPV